MIYEHRTYSILPGKTAEFIQRFGDIPVKLFEKYGAKVIGVWTTAIGPGPEVTYMLAFDDLAHREKFWHAFYQDSEFQKYAPTAEVASFNIKILKPTLYSPLK